MSKTLYVTEKTNPCDSCNGSGVFFDEQRWLDERKTTKKLGGGWDGQRAWTLEEANDIPKQLFISCRRCNGIGSYETQVSFEKAISQPELLAKIAHEINSINNADEEQ